MSELDGELDHEVTPMPVIQMGGNRVGNGNPRGVCSICGKPAYKGSATKCDEHRGATSQPRVTTRSAGSGDPVVELGSDGPQIRVTTPPPPRVAVPKTDKKERALALEAMLINDVNPVLLQGFAMVCKPLSPDNFYQVQTAPDGTQRMLITEYGNQVLITPMEAKVLGNALAELEGNETLKFLGPMAGPVVPILWAVAAVGVVGFHGYKLAGLRTTLVTQAQAQLTTPYGGPVGVVPDQDPTGTGDPGPVTPNPAYSTPQFPEGML